MSQSLSNNNNSFNTIVNVSGNYTVADDRSNILAWLSPLEPKLRHRDIQDRRVKNVGGWLLQTGEFRSWYAGSGGGESVNAVLFCSGDPGVGKTYISSLVIDSLCDRAGGQNVAVACFYFDFAAQKEQSSISILGALLKQVVSGLDAVPQEIAQAYEDQKKAIGGRAPQLSDVVKMLQTTSSKQRTFICIDALDECEAGYRIKLLDSLNQILQKSPGIRIFLTGRPHIQTEIGRRFSGVVRRISITPRRDDIISYLRSRLDQDTNPDAMNGSLEADILKKIPEDVSEIFLLVSLNIDAILQETTIRRRRQKLSAMTDGLGLEGAYGVTLGRIKAQGGERSRLGIAALMWISHSERPLEADELCHALAVEIGLPNLDADGVPSIGTVLASCQGLIVVDKEASTVRLIHFTLQEYLRAHPALFNTPHATMAETCLSYLNSHQVKALSTSTSPHPQDTPFLEYSSLYWGVHAKKDLSNCAKSLALALFSDYNNHISSKLLLEAWGLRWLPVGSNKSSQFSALHCASFFGIVEIVACLVEAGGCDINQKDLMGKTPLVWAAWKGHEGVVKTLLERNDVNPEIPDNYGRTPLSWAAACGDERVVKALLGRGNVNPDKPDKYGLTPLNLAAQNGHEGVVKILLGRNDVNPDKPHNGGRTPLNRAARNGHEGVVKVLLGRGDVNPNKPDNGGRTPLLCASEDGHEGVVKILLDRDDVNPDKPDNHGWTPLSQAAENGHEGVVKTLLGRVDINPDNPDTRGITPLSFAAWKGHEGVVKVLLGQGDVNPDRPDDHSRAPLWWAALGGHEGVVKILLRRKDVNPDRPDNDGRTPLWWAAKRGHAGVVALLRPPVFPTSSTA